ncbi:MAG: DUF3080 family protein [Gammaproteobacteria bacterium]|nr:DUF3080 family protein [Gammaproteobacteria bacterium]
MRLHSLSLTLVCLLLSACTSDEATSLVERYASRTANAIEIDFDLALRPNSALYTQLPPRRERLAEVPEIRQGLLDLLDLRACDLMQLVSERNTSLGRVAGPSQRLIYELKILPRLQQCVVQLETDPERAELRGELLDFVQIKQSGFAALVFNATYNTDEMEQHFSFGAAPLQPNQIGYLTPLLEPFQRLLTVAELSKQESWPTPEFTDDLESSFEALYRADFGARWISSMALLTQTLEQTSAAIERRLEGRPICFNKRQNAKSKILWNVFMKFYVGELQPYIAQVEREGRQWSQLHMQILDSLETETVNKVYPLISTQKDSIIWGRYIRARDRHTAAWQNQLDQCGLRPGAANKS